MKNIFKGLSLVLVALFLVVGVGAGSAGATLTFDATSVVSNGALTLNGAAAGAIVLGNSGQTSAISIGDTAVSTVAEISLGGGNGVKTAINIGDGSGANGITIGGAASLLTLGATLQGASPLVFEGLTADAFELTFAIPDVGADATITFPSATGTLATLAGTETLSGKTLTAPKFADGGFIADAAGLTMLSFDSAAAAVNYFEATNSATGVGLSLLAKGTDANISVSYNSKGSGVHRFQEQSATGDTIAIDPQETSADAFTGTLTSPDLTANRTWTFPNVTGTVITTGDTDSITDAMVSNTLTASSATAATTATNLAGGLAGTLPYQTAAGTTGLLGIGTAGQVLTVNAGATAPEWTTFIASLGNTSAWTAAQKLDAGITVDTTNFTVDGTTGAVHVAGDFDVATPKFTVAAASGNTLIQGTLGVTGAITGNLTGNASTATSATSATSATTAGTVTTAAQPAITSVGTLTGLTSTGAIDLSGASSVRVTNNATVYADGLDAGASCAAGNAGQIVFTTNDSSFYGCDGANWQVLN